jgi:5-methylcytosine-specific restriction endonuclease McrA
VLLSSFDPEQEFDTMTQELRDYVYSRDEGQCLKCGNLGSDPHHVIYRSKGGKHKANNIATLCNKCHHKIHNITDDVKGLLLQRIKESEQRLRDSLS